MLIIGLTGSIAMGKSSACHYLMKKGLPVFSADQVVHELYKERAVPLIFEAFPQVIVDGMVDRSILSKHLMAHPESFQKLETIIHPLVKEQRLAFLRQHMSTGSKAVILDIPLLFEKQLEDSVDVILLVTAPASVQFERVMQRPDMTLEKFEMIRSHQMNDADKRARADFIVDTSGPFEQTHARLDEFLESLHNYPQRAARKIEGE